MPHLAPHRGTIALSLSALAGASVFGLLVPWMTRDAVDGLSAADPLARLARAVGFLVLFAALHAAFRYLGRRGLLLAARRVEQGLRDVLFSHVVRLPAGFFSGTPTGDVMSRLTNDLAAVWLFLGPGLLTLAGTVVSYVLAISFMIRLSPLLTAVAMAVAPAVILLSRQYGRAFHDLHRQSQEALAAMNADLQENVTGIRLVKAYALEEREGRRFRAAADACFGRSVALARASAAFHGAIGLAAGGGAALVLWVGARLVVQGELSLGGFVAFNAYLAMLSFPTMAMGWVINLVQRGESAMGRINDILRRPAEGAGDGRTAEEDGAGNVALSPASGGPGEEPPLLAIANLSFAYGEGRGNVLDGVSFSVRRGEVVGIAGPTGCGKSTLLSLLLRLHPVPPRTVYLEGRDIAALPLAALRRRMAYVPQDPFLFSDTLLSNIAYGASREDPGAAREAAGVARIQGEIEAMAGGLSAVVGERGISLSGGQKQRAAIARALCAEGELLLLDDALSSVDAATEREIFDGLVTMRERRTILFCTHRMASLSRCDRIVVLRAGRVAEAGTHEELFAMRGVYHDMYSRQMLLRELEEEA